MGNFLKEAFLLRWNLLFFVGGAAAAAMTPLAPVLLPLVAAGEMTYLTGLVSIPRFRAAIDAKVHAAGQAAAASAAPPAPSVSLVTMLAGLPTEARARFQRLHGRCVEMRGIAAGVRGAAGDPNAGGEEIRTPRVLLLEWRGNDYLEGHNLLRRFILAHHMPKKDGEPVALPFGS